MFQNVTFKTLQNVTKGYNVLMRKLFDYEKVRGEIKARKLKVKDLADAIGVTPNTLSSALNGNRALGKSAQISLARELSSNSKAPKKSSTRVA